MATISASFLGANTPKGFVSFFDELYNPYKNGDTYIIKGGPGSGKSTFMKKIARAFEERGFSSERVYCSSDPSSLDALIIPETSFCICDGTAPHIVEPRFPGSVENIINLGAFWNEKKLKKNSDEIRRLFLENSIYHTRSAKYLAAAGHIDSQTRKIAFSCLRREKIDSFSSRFIYRELSSKSVKAPGERKKRFLSAITPRGNIFLSETVKALCPRVIGIEDSEGVVASLVTERVGEGAIRNGLTAIFAHCPMNPNESEHLLVQERGIALVRINGAAAETPCDRVIHAKRFMTDSFKESRCAIRFNNKVKAELIKESVANLKKAKSVHDKLEEIYIDAMNFDALNEFTDSFCQKLFEA